MDYEVTVTDGKFSRTYLIKNVRSDEQARTEAAYAALEEWPVRGQELKITRVIPPEPASVEEYKKEIVCMANQLDDIEMGDWNDIEKRILRRHLGSAWKSLERSLEHSNKMGE